MTICPLYCSAGRAFTRDIFRKKDDVLSSGSRRSVPPPPSYPTFGVQHEDLHTFFFLNFPDSFVSGLTYTDIGRRRPLKPYRHGSKTEHSS